LSIIDCRLPISLLRADWDELTSRGIFFVCGVVNLRKVRCGVNSISLVQWRNSATQGGKKKYDECSGKRMLGKPRRNLRLLRHGVVRENAGYDGFLYFHRVSTEFAERRWQGRGDVKEDAKSFYRKGR
jgi:hypothetical protein